MYWFTDDQAGNAVGVAQPDTGVKRLTGAGTNILEVGQILTGAQLKAAREATEVAA